MRNSLILIGALLLVGCATLTQGTRESLRVESEPSGARVLTDIASDDPRFALDGHLGCEPTPCEISIPRKAEPRVTVSLAAHQSITFKVSSSVATSATSVPTGALVAGLPPGSHVRAGSADFLKRIPVGGRVFVGAVATYGVGALVDVASGANRNLAPNPVTAYLAPVGDEVSSANERSDSP